MIKFFRRIRQNLLSEGKTGMYLRYALGEITLVIIGILIALQINNWNESRKSKAASNALLELLNEDLRKDLVYFDSLQTEYKIWLAQTENILTNVLDGKTEKLTRFDQFTAGRSSMNFLHISKITFLEMFGSGKKLEFENPKLARDVKEYFHYAEIELIKLNSDNEYFFQSLLKYYDEIGNGIWHRLYEQRNLEYIDWSWLTNPRSKEFISLESIMSYYQLAIKENIRVIQELEKRSNLLIDQIDKNFEG